MSTVRRFLATTLVGAMIVVAAVAVGIHAKQTEVVEAAGRNEIAANGNVQGRLYPGDPEREAALVTSEQERLAFVRTVGSSAGWQLDGLHGPYRIPTAPVSTLVLPLREAPYTFADLLVIAPDTLVQQADGSFLLSEHVVVLPGATLDLRADAPLKVVLASSADSFASLVSLGGVLNIAGTEAAPVSIASRDTSSGTTDVNTADGRAYVRVLGGSTTITHADFSDLGFWSGNTGGLALTGVEDAAAEAPIAPEAADEGMNEVADEASDEASDEAATEDSDEAATEASEEGSDEVSDGTPAEAASESAAPTLSGKELAAITADDLPDTGLVTGTLQNVTTTGNAFGLFVSRATGVTIADSRVSGSLVDGVVFHRFVQNSAIRTSEIVDNAVDGVAIARSSSSVRIEDVTSSGNGRNGISFDGRPLADGPSAIGTTVSAYGDVHVVGGQIAGNARYGVEITGGAVAEITGIAFSSNLVGVLLNHDARNVDVTGNTFEGERRQSVALRGGVQDTRITDNTISSVSTGVHVENSAAAVTGNTFTGIGNHAVTLVGTATGARVTGNTISGNGTTAIHDDDASGAVVGRNDVEGWKTAPTVVSVLRSVFQPLTIVWVALGLLLLITALSGRRRRGIRHPYADRLPLTALSRGVVSPDTLRGMHS
ncbi:right-handed parallel beta-helix repeat-containing protein [Agromyces humi]|uniref:right-handed parallel beta-helix repeat-containing protein n=1 Tax=Agromyces humi TaxID=1766800 RepID=UPI0013568FBC|nr:right-handed parallel beta-helix repeat-containing protein [Agromyces humi]